MLQNGLLENEKTNGKFLDNLKTSFQMIFKALPIMLSSTSSLAYMLINISFAGHLSVNALASIGIANTWINFVGRGPLISCNCGFFALASQVNGSGFLLLCSSYILPLCGVDKNIVEGALPYIYCYIFCLFLEIFSDMLKHFLDAKMLFYIPPYATLVCVIIHFIQCFYFVRIYENIVVLAFSRLLTNIYWVLAAFLIAKYQKLEQHISYLWSSFESEAKDNLLDYAKIVIPSALSTYVEWMAYEITTIMASNYEAVILSAHTVFYFATTFCYNLFYGIGIFYASTLGNALGDKNLQLVSYMKSLLNFLIISLMISYTIFSLLFFKTMIKLLTNQPEVIEKVEPLLILAYTLCNFDVSQGVFSEALRVIGQQKFAAKTFFQTYYLFGLPFGLIVGIFLDFRLIGWFSGLYLTQLLNCWFFRRRFYYTKIEENILAVETFIDNQFDNK